jgi:hypothetical protein
MHYYKPYYPGFLKHCYCVAYVTRPRWNSCFVMLWKKFQRMLKGSALSSMNIDH